MSDEIIGICAICGRDIKKGGGRDKDTGLCYCPFRCVRKFQQEKKKWTTQQIAELQQKQEDYIHSVQASSSIAEELPIEAKAVIGNEQVLGSVTGYGLAFRKLQKKIIVTDSRIIFFDPRMIGVAHTEVPYAQLTGVKYEKPKALIGTFTVTTQSGNTTMQIDYKDHEIAITLLKTLQTKIMGIAGVPISIIYDKGMFSESWGFYAPPQLAIMMASRQVNIRATESIPDQIKKLSDLKEAGILTTEEFESKKKELLKRL